MRSPFADSPEFRRLIEAETVAATKRRVDLARVALEIAGDAYPGLDPIPYLDRLDALADRVQARCGATSRARQALHQINWVLFVEEGFAGDAEDYHDPRNSYLNEVIERKTGIPITLAVVYERLAERVGVDLAGVNAPGHFLLRLQGPAEPGSEQTLFVDPFHQGAFLDREGAVRRVAEAVGRPVALTDEELAPCSTATIVARMLRNLKVIHFQRHDLAAALPVVRRLAALAPDDPSEQHELVMLAFRLDRPAEAVVPLERLVAADPDDEEGRRLLSAARRESARRN